MSTLLVRVLSQSEISVGFYVLVCRIIRPQINRLPAPINGFDSKHLLAWRREKKDPKYLLLLHN